MESEDPSKGISYRGIGGSRIGQYSALRRLGRSNLQPFGPKGRKSTPKNEIENIIKRKI